MVDGNNCYGTGLDNAEVNDVINFGMVILTRCVMIIYYWADHFHLLRIKDGIDS